MGVELLTTPIEFLRSSLSIGHDEVEATSSTIFVVVLKTNEGVLHPTCRHLVQHGLIREHKHFGCSTVGACYLRQPDSLIFECFPDPFCDTFVKAFVDSLQVNDLLRVAPKLCDDNEALRLGDRAAKLFLSGGMRSKLEQVFVSWAGHFKSLRHFNYSE